ncbi:hypothetical protein DFH28DRAFT_917168 [Melampsora americana]|nr:hypothetical protein DFH28DRAFT_917168 [Melampsora americana]
MATLWNPDTRNEKGQWQMQSSSSDDWTSLTNTKWKLLEHFVRHITQSDLKTKPTRPKKPQASDLLKSKLTAKLNNLVRQYLKPPFNHLDCHPKTPSSHVTLKGRTFKGNTRLEVIQHSNSRMTDALLATAFEKMAARTHQMWVDDIEDGYYAVVKQAVDDDEDRKKDPIPEDLDGDTMIDHKGEQGD